MKFITVVLSLLLFCIIGRQPLLLYFADAADQPEPVLDIDGDEVQVNAKYYVVSAIWGAGGGGLAKASPEGFPPCPEAVIQLLPDVQLGEPVFFRPVNTSKGVVRLSTDLNVIFDNSTYCEGSTSVWMVMHDHPINTDFINTGGLEGHPGSGTLMNWFKIVKVDSLVYKFTYCPSVCKSCAITACRDIGIKSFGTTRRLDLMEIGETPTLLRPFPVTFRKASSI